MKASSWSPFLVVLVLMSDPRPLGAEQRGSLHRVVYVDDDAAPGGDGTSWAQAYDDLQPALELPDPPLGSRIEIRVAGGVYRPSKHGDPNEVPRGYTFYLQNQRVLLGGFKGSLPGANTRDLRRFESVLEGDRGVQGDPSDNSWRILTASSVDATSVVDGFSIRNARADEILDRGAALWIDAGAPTVRRCRFVGNYAAHEGGAVYARGPASFEDCVFEDNRAENEGGGAVSNRDRGTYVRCLFRGNSGRRGAAVLHATFARPVFRECVFVDNADSFAMSTERGQPTLLNCTFVGNPLGALRAFDGAVLRNSILWDCGATPLVTVVVPEADAAHCLVQGGYPGEENIDSDPRFVNAANRDLRLECSSPCIDAGSPEPSASLQDLEGDARAVDGDGDGSIRVDIGADEFDFLWSARGSFVTGESVGFVCQAPPGRAGQEARVFISLGDGGLNGAIPLSPSRERLGLDLDALFKAWSLMPEEHRVVTVAPCPGSATAEFLLERIPAGTRVFYAGVLIAGGVIVDRTPTHSFLLLDPP